MIFEKIKEILVENLDVDGDTLTPSTNLLDDLDADSLDLFQMISDVEDEFDITVDNIEEVKTIQDVIDLVEKK